MCSCHPRTHLRGDLMEYSLFVLFISRWINSFKTQSPRPSPKHLSILGSGRCWRCMMLSMPTGVLRPGKEKITKELEGKWVENEKRESRIGREGSTHCEGRCHQIAYSSSQLALSPRNTAYVLLIHKYPSPPSDHLQLRASRAKVRMEAHIPRVQIVRCYTSR